MVECYNSDIVFEEVGHTYTRNGHTAPISVTGLISKYFPLFDGVAVVDKYFKSWKIRASSKYYELIHAHTNDADAKQAILDLWEENKNEACRLGTDTHKAVELLLGGAPLESCGNPEVEAEINSFLKWHQEKSRMGWEFVASELVVGGVDEDDKLCLGGSVDAIFKDEKGAFVLVDWKRTGKAFGPEEDAPFADFGSGPMSHLKDTKYNRYATQLAVYARLLSRIGIDVGNRRILVRLTKDGAEQIEASGAVFDEVAEKLVHEAGVAELQSPVPVSKRLKASV